MATKMITRTMKTMNIKVEYADLTARVIGETIVSIPYVKGRNVDKKAAEMLPDGCRMLSSEIVEIKNTIYGMDEMEFLRLAKPVIRGNNGTAKPVEDCKPEEQNEGSENNGTAVTPDIAGGTEAGQPTSEPVENTESKIAAKKAAKMQKHLE